MLEEYLYNAPLIFPNSPPLFCRYYEDDSEIVALAASILHEACREGGLVSSLVE